MGRTRPKKLTSKASIPVVREQDIDAIEDDVQNALQQIETGVEKAEESVSYALAPSLSISRDIIPTSAHRENFAPQPKHPQQALINVVFARNSICKPL